MNGTTSFACLSATVSPALTDELPPADARRIEMRIQALAKFGANLNGGVSRVAFSAADLAGREYIKGLMRDAGLAVRVDSAGNVIGRLEGTGSALPAIILGSHIDSVPEGGNYDGDVGVIGAIEVATLLRENGVRHETSTRDRRVSRTKKAARSVVSRWPAISARTHSV